MPDELVAEPHLERLLEVAKRAAQLARSVVVDTPATQTVDKGDRDIVTNIDLAVEEKVMLFLAQETPDIGFLGEEGSTRPPTEMKWVLDPIDGTGNFARRLPLYGTSLSLVDNGCTIVALIDLPAFDGIYTAIRGTEGRVNGHVLECSRTSSLNNATVGFSDFARREDSIRKNANMVGLMDALGGRARHVRILGSAITTLAWVADGRLDAAILASNDQWDTSAGILIAECSGARAWDLHGNPHGVDSDSVVLVSPGIERELLQLIQEVTGSYPDIPSS